MPDRRIVEFFEEEYTQFAAYDVYRKIPSICDGLKMSSRKVIYTMLKYKIRAIKKVSQLQSKVSEETQYLHGEASIGGVIVGMVQDYPGANNICMLLRDGQFGTRLEPAAAAPRYIKTGMLPIMEKIFRAEDNPILIGQAIEGEDIEPRFYVPTIPMLIVNGSEGMAVGFAHKVLPREPKKLIQYIKQLLLDKGSRYDFMPYYKGFKGSVRKVMDGTYEIRGVLNRVNTTKIHITEIPVGISLDNYKKHLNKLQEKGEIRNYKDKSEKGKFEFIVNVPREITTRNSDDDLLRKFKLIKTETENLTTLSEELTVDKFNTIQDVMEEYIEIKLDFMGRRKTHMISTQQDLIDLLMSKASFIKALIDEKLKLAKRKTEAIYKDMDKIDKVFRIDNKYDYLLGMPIGTITPERYQKLLDQIKEAKLELKRLKKISPEEMWISDLDELDKLLK